MQHVHAVGATDERTKDPMQDQLGPAFLGVLSLLFGSYGLRELAVAYNVEPLGEWSEKAWVGAGSLTLCTLLAICSYRLMAGIIVAVP